MRQHVAKLAPAVLVGGCSLIYNPNDIDRAMIDARTIDTGETPVDMEMRADAMPRDLTVSEAFPPTIDEGSGTGGSRKAVVVLKGHNFVKDGANLMVSIAPEMAGIATLDAWEVAGNGDFVALELTVPIDTTCAESTLVNVDVTVQQDDGAGGTVMQTLDNGFQVRCLDELDAAPTSTTGLKTLYSRIQFSGALDLTATSAAAIPAAIFRSASSIDIDAVDASASARNPGPGGGVGGAPQGNGTGLKFGGGIGNVSSGGGGAGFLVAGGAGGTGLLGAAGGVPGGTTGDPWIASYGANQSSGGGGGGPASVSGSPGAGGGGGGTLELTARGDVTVGAITADGGNGSLGNSDTGDGGAGTGGVVLIRAGNMLTASTVSVTKGGTGGGNGGTSSDGRVRVDAAKGAFPTGPTLCAIPFAAACNLTRGPMFVDVPTKTTNQMHTFTIRGTPNDDASITVRVFDKAGNAVVNSLNGVSTYTPTFGLSGEAMVTPVLKAGYNKICAWVPTGAPDIAESANCVELAYLPL
jgi:hypothetical protein